MQAFRKELGDLFATLQRVEAEIYDLLNAAGTTSAGDDAQIIGEIMRTYIRTYSAKHSINVLMKPYAQLEERAVAAESRDYI